MTQVNNKVGPTIGPLKSKFREVKLNEKPEFIAHNIKIFSEISTKILHHTFRFQQSHDMKMAINRESYLLF